MNTFDFPTILVKATGTMSSLHLSTHLSTEYQSPSLNTSQPNKLDTSMVGSFHALHIQRLSRTNPDYKHQWFVLQLLYYSDTCFNEIGAGGKRAKGSAFQTVSSLYRVNRKYNHRDLLL